MWVPSLIKVNGTESLPTGLVFSSFMLAINEIIKDLLNPSGKMLKIRENADNGIYVEGLCELVRKLN